MGFIEFENELNDCGLSCAREPCDGVEASCFEYCGEVFEDGFVGVGRIRKSHILELNVAN